MRTLSIDTEPKHYSEDIDSAISKEDLIEKIKVWSPYVDDALQQANAIVDFEYFRQGLIIERKGEPGASDEWMNLYGHLLLPDDLMQGAIDEINFHVPFMVCLKRRKGLE